MAYILHPVLSPPCGMATPKSSYNQPPPHNVLSPPCGMATILGHLQATTQTRVLSPPCGMETGNTSFWGAPSHKSSEPTVWDGDKGFLGDWSPNVVDGSEPTVWDGDVLFNQSFQIIQPQFRAHRVGWRLLHICYFSISPSLFRAHRVGWRQGFFRGVPDFTGTVPSPPCGMATAKQRGTKKVSQTVPSPPCGMATSISTFMTCTSFF